MTAPKLQVPDHFEAFDIGLLGGPGEQLYRKARPEIDAMPWGTIDLSAFPETTIARARRVWTMAAFQEYRTGAACSLALQHLFRVQAPLDLIAVATRFPLDEVVHVELCGRLVAELGGAMELRHDPASLVPRLKPGLDPLLQCAEIMMRVFCVGEAVSIPILRASWQHAELPLLRAILGRIVKDEAVHGQLGFWFLDWCGDAFDADERAHLERAARDEIGKLLQSWARFETPALGAEADEVPGAFGLSDAGDDAGTLGWMPVDVYLPTAHQALDDAVLKPLLDRGFDPRRAEPIPGH